MALALLETGRWQDVAACLGLDVNTFYPAKGAGYGAARRICADCLVVADCRKMADRAERGEPISHLFGMFAGEFPLERIRRHSVSPTVSPSGREAGSTRRHDAH